MGRRKHIGTAERLLGIGERTRAHRNFLDARGQVRTVRQAWIALELRPRLARWYEGAARARRVAEVRCVRLSD